MKKKTEGESKKCAAHILFIGVKMWMGTTYLYFYLFLAALQPYKSMVEEQVQKRFSALLSKQKLFRMSTGCQKVSQTDRKIYRAPGRQTERTKVRRT